MEKHFRVSFYAVAFLFGVLMFSAGCGSQAGIVNVNTASASNSSNTVATNLNSNSVNSNAARSACEAAEPTQYQATVTVKIETLGDQHVAAWPALSAKVARNSSDRRMEFMMPAGGRVVFLDKAGTNYLILPEKKQYAELNKESLGFEVRRMLMPEQIVTAVKGVSGMERVGEEKFNGRDALKYRYSATANTQTNAGNVDSESFLLVDKETGLPLHSETVARSQTGANVQGYSGMRVVTDISDITTATEPGIFDQPASYEKIDASQVRAAVDMTFNALAAVLSQAMRQSHPADSQTGTPAR